MSNTSQSNDPLDQQIPIAEVLATRSRIATDLDRWHCVMIEVDRSKSPDELRRAYAEGQCDALYALIREVDRVLRHALAGTARRAA